jgi:mevalonate pyrophosphate decarboxylase
LPDIKIMAMLRTDIKNLSKEVTCAREMAILGDYDGAISKFKNIFKTVHQYAKRYEAAPTAASTSSSGAGYAAQTASSAKKSSSKAAA